MSIRAAALFAHLACALGCHEQIPRPATEPAAKAPLEPQSPVAHDADREVASPAREAGPCREQDFADCQRRCAASDAASCFAFGSMVINKKGPPTDPRLGVVAYRTACDGKIANACLALGVIHQNGSYGVAVDSSGAADFYQRACDLGEVRGCNNLGVMYEREQGRTQDMPRALVLYRESCDRGHALACRNVGRFFRDGKGGVTDPRKANAAFERAATLSRSACDAGVAEGCSTLGFMHRSGTDGIPKDEALALRYLQLACDLGYRAICAEIDKR